MYESDIEWAAIRLEASVVRVSRELTWMKFGTLSVLVTTSSFLAAVWATTRILRR